MFLTFAACSNDALLPILLILYSQKNLNFPRRLREDAGVSEKGLLDSKDREIRHLSEKVRTMETEYDMLLQKDGKEKLKATREIADLQTKIDTLESEIRAANREMASSSRDTGKFDAEISRLTKERDLTRYLLDERGLP